MQLYTFQRRMLASLLAGATVCVARRAGKTLVRDAFAGMSPVGVILDDDLPAVELVAPAGLAVYCRLPDDRPLWVQMQGRATRQAARNPRKR